MSKRIHLASLALAIGLAELLTYLTFKEGWLSFAIQIQQPPGMSAMMAGAAVFGMATGGAALFPAIPAFFVMWVSVLCGFSLDLGCEAAAITYFVFSVWILTCEVETA